MQWAGGAVRMPKGIRRPLIIKLKRGWKYNSTRRAFVSITGKKVFRPQADLPKGSRVSYLVPALQKMAPETRSADERNLVLYLHLTLPKGIDPAKLLPTVQRWDCVEEVYEQPEVSLP